MYDISPCELHMGSRQPPASVLGNNGGSRFFKWRGNYPIRNATSIWKEKYFIQTQVGLYSWNEVIWAIEDDISEEIAINYFKFVILRKSKKYEIQIFVCYDAI